MKIQKRIKKFLEEREKILKEAKKFKKKKDEVCPLNFDGIAHHDISQMFDGLGCWKWNCPFCHVEFQE